MDQNKKDAERAEELYKALGFSERAYVLRGRDSLILHNHIYQLRKEVERLEKENRQLRNQLETEGLV